MSGEIKCTAFNDRVRPKAALFVAQKQPSDQMPEKADPKPASANMLPFAPPTRGISHQCNSDQPPPKTGVGSCQLPR